MCIRDSRDIRSEAAAIHVMGIAGILDDFLGEERMAQTVSGRMGSGSFEFQVKGNGDRCAYTIQVRNSQVEIDGGFEGKTSFALIEGKNVVHSNFLIRQLYYPYRLWQERIRKNVRPVFMVYSNSIFRLLEYAFSDICDYSSIRLVREKRYSLEAVSYTHLTTQSMFENDVILYGSQTATLQDVYDRMFENDVILYGSQT